MNTNKTDSKLLIVDDQPKNIQVLGSLLKDHGYIVGVAMNGLQALNALNSNQDYDLVLLDINMPDMDGLEVCSEMRKNAELQDIPVIFLTAMVEAEDIIKGFEVGGQDYVTKPFNSKELLARVETQLELKHSRDKLMNLNNWLEAEVAKRTLELELANSKLMQLDRAKTEFLNIINHEIRTPLIGIKGAVGVLQYMDCPKDVKDMLEILYKSSGRLEEFSYKALDITNLNTKGEGALEKQLCDIYESVSESTYRHKESAKAKSIIFRINKNADNTLLQADKAFLDKCFSFIMENAVKFANEDTEIEVNILDVSNNIVVTIDDEGQMFPENYDITSISPFQTDTHIDSNPSLSLFLCKLIVEAHDGEIALSNTSNGARVTVSLPKNI